MTLMDRKNNLRAFERGVRAMLGQGIRVKVDLIIGLPGDTVASVRRGLHYLRDGGLCSDLQAFNLAVLPGTAFRQEAAELGLVYQPRPPYYVLRTPTLGRADLYGLMQEAQDLFEVEFDPQPRPVLDLDEGAGPDPVWRVDLRRGAPPPAPPADRRARAFTLWLRSAHLDRQREHAAGLIRQVLADNPHTTLQVVLEPTDPDPAAVPQQVPPRLLEALLAVCQEAPTYLDKFYAMQPGSANGAKRLIVLLPLRLRPRLDLRWAEEVGDHATLVWRTAGADGGAEAGMAAHEYAWTAGAPFPVSGEAVPSARG
jgi:hypothetical protein